MNLRSILRCRIGVRSLENMYGGLIRVLRVSGTGIVLSSCKGHRLKLPRGVQGQVMYR